MENTTITIIIAFVAVLLLWRLFILLPFYRKRKANLVSQFRQVRIKSLRLQKQLSKYMLSNDLNRHDFTEGMTVGDYYRYLKKNHITYLSDKNYLKVKKSQNPIGDMRMLNILKEQEERLKDAEHKIAGLLESN